MGTEDHTIKIFVSSPGDVEEERLIAQRVLKRLADQFSQVVQIEPIFWEHEPLLATQTFQAGIPSPAETDIVVCILWARIGTRLPPSIHRPDGSPYASGTEYEFETAAEEHRRRGQPDLLVYRKTAQPDPQAREARESANLCRSVAGAGRLFHQVVSRRGWDAGGRLPPVRGAGRVRTRSSKSISAS